MTPTHIGPEPTVLRALLDRSKCLLLDFDGPVCRLFSGRPAALVAAEMRQLIKGRATLDHLAPTQRSDPHLLLRAPMPDRLTADLGAVLTNAEELAALSAAPTPGADDFIRAADAAGRLLAITTNNAPSAVVAYLKEHGLDGYFGSRIFGRGDDPSLMKPHPDCLLRAVEALGAAPQDCLMIGDSLPDAQAAVAAGIGFLGYARSEDRVARLRTVDPHPVVVGMAGLVAAARSLIPPNG